MPELSITVASTFGVFGLSPTNKWGSMVWGTDNWGNTEDLTFEIEKVYGNTQSMTISIIKDAEISVSSTQSVSDGYSKEPDKSFANSINMSSDATEIIRIDAAGFYYIFGGGIIDGEEQVITSYSQVAIASDPFTKLAITSTTWVGV